MTKPQLQSHWILVQGIGTSHIRFLEDLKAAPQQRNDFATALGRGPCALFAQTVSLNMLKLKTYWIFQFIFLHLSSPLAKNACCSNPQIVKNNQQFLCTHFKIVNQQPQQAKICPLHPRSMIFGALGFCLHRPMQDDIMRVMLSISLQEQCLEKACGDIGRRLLAAPKTWKVFFCVAGATFREGGNISCVNAFCCWQRNKKYVIRWHDHHINSHEMTCHSYIEPHKLAHHMISSHCSSVYF